MPSAGAYAVWAVLAGVAAAALAARARRPAAWQIAALTLTAAASIVAFVFVSWGRATPFGDFNKAYYHAGSVILTAPSRLYACDVSNLCFVSVPVVAVLFAPLALVGRTAAQIAFAIAGAAAVAATVWLTMQEAPEGSLRRVAVPLLFAFNGPLLYSARLGNITHLMLPFVMLASLWLIRRREWRAGALLGTLAVLKPPLLLFLPYLLLRRRLRAAAALCLTIGALAIVSVTWFGIELHRQWLTQFLGPFAVRPVGAYNVQSIAGLLAHFVYPGRLTDWVPIDVPAGFRLVSSIAVAAILLSTVALLVAAAPPATPSAHWTEVSIVVVVSLLASPLTWTHYYAFCLIPLTQCVAGTLVVREARTRVAVAIACVLVSAPVVLALPGRPWLQMLTARVLISHYAVGGIVLWGALCAVGARSLRTARGTDGPGRSGRSEGILARGGSRSVKDLDSYDVALYPF